MKTKTMNTKLFFPFLTIILSLTSCNNRINKAITELQNMPAPDYSYVIQPDYSISKESIEFKIKELFSSEEVKVGAVGIHGYDKETNAQKDEKILV